MVFGFFRRRDPHRAAVDHLYRRVAAAARQPDLYESYGVPDTTQGRLEALELHAILAMRRLRDLPPPADAIGQAFVDTVFEQVEHALREIGMGDTTVPKRMKLIARGFYGRALTYGAALDAGDAVTLAAALGRNVLNGDGPAPQLARYAMAAEAHLAGLSLAQIAPQPDAAAPELFPDARALRLAAEGDLQ
ncbi:ubiquinol-cytochrome C chaperone family protein [Camelimonas abortus]|uniref:Ubiquinol-cytochrome C chaperone family protein n=1 Tax=Camelimonas abortus TaxID=1017184 RepID=A0ABV7LC50_9HYPH